MSLMTDPDPPSRTVPKMGGCSVSSVDVVVPCYRYGHFLRQCVESVLNQCGVDVRVLIIDDASPDNTAEIAAALVKDDPRVNFIRHSENKGHIATYNEGIEWASADYMLILSADDYLLPGALSRAVNLMDAHPEVGFAFGNVIELRDGGIKKPVRSQLEAALTSDRILTGLEFIKLSGPNCLVATCTAVVRTLLQKLLGGYRPELPHAGDMEMWLRFAAHASVGFVSAPQGVYRRHISNMSTRYYHYTADGRFVYTADGRLADLEQRKAVFDCFFGSSSSALTHSDKLRRILFQSLGTMAVQRASASFNNGELEACKQLAGFAIGVYPRIKTSIPWIKLICKRRLGLRTWQALRPALAGRCGGPLDPE
jgi:glycosyltransferase involved in cell wall biosynthesis